MINLIYDLKKALFKNQNKAFFTFIITRVTTQYEIFRKYANIYL